MKKKSMPMTTYTFQCQVSKPVLLGKWEKIPWKSEKKSKFWGKYAAPILNENDMVDASFVQELYDPNIEILIKRPRVSLI